jgi:metal-responsive CopG/Arc/MetJ family transcriptional regulator
MGKEKIAITLDQEFIDELEGLVRRRIFQNRSQAINEAVSKKLLRLKRRRLSIECAKLERVAEKAWTEEGIPDDLSQWPKYCEEKFDGDAL